MACFLSINFSDFTYFLIFFLLKNHKPPFLAQKHRNSHKTKSKIIPFFLRVFRVHSWLNLSLAFLGFVDFLLYSVSTAGCPVDCILLMPPGFVKIQVREFTEELFGLSVVGLCCLDLVIESAQVDAFSVEGDFCPPFSFLLVPGNTFVF